MLQVDVFFQVDVNEKKMFGHSAGNSKSLGAPKFVSRFVLFQRDMIIDHNANEDALVTTTNTCFLSYVFFPGMTSLTRLGVCCRYHHDHIGHILLNEDHHDLCGDAGNEDHLICTIMISW